MTMRGGGRKGGIYWNPEEYEELRRFHEDYWKRFKHDWGYRPGDKIDWIPGFRESIQSLLDQGYTLTDVALFVGVSRQRVTQWCDKLGIEKRDGVTPYRVWSDEEMRFVPLTKEGIAQSKQDERKRQEALKERKIEIELERRTKYVEQNILAFYELYGRLPFLKEIADACGYKAKSETAVDKTAACNAFCAWLGLGNSNDKQIKIGRNRLDRIYIDRGWLRPDGRLVSSRQTPSQWKRKRLP